MEPGAGGGGEGLSPRPGDSGGPVCLQRGALPRCCGSNVKAGTGGSSVLNRDAVFQRCFEVSVLARPAAAA